LQTKQGKEVLVWGITKSSEQISRIREKLTAQLYEINYDLLLMRDENNRF